MSVKIRPKPAKKKTISAKSKTLELTEREERFCREYACDAGLNATRAYRSAFPAVSYNAAKTEASKLLTKPYIKARISEMELERARRLEITPERVLSEIAKLAFYDPRSFFNDDGRLKNISELEPDHAAVIGGLEMLQKNASDGSGGTTVTTKIKLPDKTKNLQLLARYLKMFSETTPAPENALAPILQAVLDDQLSPREAGYKINALGLPLPEILKLELQKVATEAETSDGDYPVSGEELERRAREHFAAIEEQRRYFLPERRQEVQKLKEELKQHDSFDS